MSVYACRQTVLEWTATIVAHECAVDFGIRLTNLGEQTLHKAGGAICLRFLDAPWWSDEDTYVLSSGSMASLASLERNAGRSNAFQAYLIGDQSYDHVFYREFWGFNRRRLDKPIMISENGHEEVCTIIQANQAYFLHSNRGNPCTDLMLSFGDMEPKASSQAEGKVWIKRGRAADVIKEITCHPRDGLTPHLIRNVIWPPFIEYRLRAIRPYAMPLYAAREWVNRYVA